MKSKNLSCWLNIVAKVFDKQQVTCFPPEREEELKIEMLPEAPKEIDCKVYPLSWAEQDKLQVFLMEEEGELTLHSTHVFHWQERFWGKTSGYGLPLLERMGHAQ
jgi:hypothetical protein